MKLTHKQKLDIFILGSVLGFHSDCHDAYRASMTPEALVKLGNMVGEASSSTLGISDEEVISYLVDISMSIIKQVEKNN